MTSLKAAITSIGRFLPDKILNNHDLEAMVETSDQWILDRTGIRERRIAEKGTGTSALASAAAQEALSRRGVSADEVDLIIVATVTPDMMFPSTAALVQNNLNAQNAWGYDLSAACSGFLFALESGAALIESGRSNKVIVIPEVDKKFVTPFSEAFQSVVWHCLVSHPQLQMNKTKW